MPAHCRENYFKKPKYIIVYDYQTKAFKEKKKEFFNTLFLKKKNGLNKDQRSNRT